MFAGDFADDVFWHFSVAVVVASDGFFYGDGEVSVAEFDAGLVCHAVEGF